MKYWMNRRPADPYIPPKNPFQTFLLLLSVVASTPLIVGVSGSKSLEDHLSNTAVEIWGWALLLGSLGALAGLWFPRRKIYQGWNLERAGLILVAGAAALYTLLILTVAGSFNDVRYAACINVAYSAACVWRCVQITRLMGWYREWALLQSGEG